MFKPLGVYIALDKLIAVASAYVYTWVCWPAVRMESGLWSLALPLRNSALYATGDGRWVDAELLPGTLKAGRLE